MLPPDGLTALPHGKLATLVTFLERRLEQVPARQPLPAGISLARLQGADLTRYRALFRLIGAEWLWFSRLALDDAALREEIDHPAVDMIVLQHAGENVGLFELDLRTSQLAKLSFLGVAAAMLGRGLGQLLMAEGLNRAREAGATAIHVNTCAFDHPNALAFYIRNGFVPVRRAIELFDDPRITGLLPRDAAPHIPLMD